MKLRKVIPVSLIVLPLIFCLIAVCLRTSVAQPPQQDQPRLERQERLERQTQQRQEQQREGFRQFDGEAFQRMMLFRMALPVAIYANDKYVYVVRGNVLYQFDAETLQLKNRVVLEDVIPLGAGGLQRRER